MTDIEKKFEFLQKEARAKVDNATKSKVDKSKDIDHDIQLMNSMMNVIDELIATNNTKDQVIENFKNQDLYPNGYGSTTQYWESSLAKNLYNMTGNALQINSYLAMRQLLGIVNGSARQTTNNFTQQQQMQGLVTNFDETMPQNNNGTGVGLVTEDIQVQGWWLWIFILNRIEYFANLVEWETEDKHLKKALHDYMFNAITSGYALIERKEVKGEMRYRSLAINNISVDEWGIPNEDVSAYAGQLMIHHSQDVELVDIDLNDENVVYSSWKSNGYSIWFYVLAYLMQAVDLLYIFFNKARMTKTVVLQKKANGASASTEAKAITDPYQLIVPINTVGYGESETVVLENRYQVEELGNPEVNMGLLENFYSWMSYWDGVIGIRTAGDKTGENRSITDEIKPFNYRTDKIQHTYLNPLDELVEMIKEKWGVEVSYVWLDESISKENDLENPAFKNEGGNEGEQEMNNGGAE